MLGWQALTVVPIPFHFKQSQTFRSVMKDRNNVHMPDHYRPRPNSWHCYFQCKIPSGTVGWQVLAESNGFETVQSLILTEMLCPPNCLSHLFLLYSMKSKTSLNYILRWNWKTLWTSTFGQELTAPSYVSTRLHEFGRNSYLFKFHWVSVFKVNTIKSSPTFRGAAGPTIFFRGGGRWVVNFFQQKLYKIKAYYQERGRGCVQVHSACIVILGQVTVV